MYCCSSSLPGIYIYCWYACVHVSIPATHTQTNVNPRIPLLFCILMYVLRAAVCMLSPLFLPVDIQRNQRPCRFFNPGDTQALCSQKYDNRDTILICSKQNRQCNASRRNPRSRRMCAAPKGNQAARGRGKHFSRCRTDSLLFKLQLSEEHNMKENGAQGQL